MSSPEYSFTMLDDTGSRRLSEQQRLMLHIIMETEPDASTETSHAGVAVLSALSFGETATSSAPAPPVVEPDRTANVPSAQAAVAV